ncbi:hypothetical protein KCU86_g6896, partial [Aureobasidium melanogenum]
MPPFVLWVRDFEAGEEPFELGPLPSDLVLNGDDDLEVIHFFTDKDTRLFRDNEIFTLPFDLVREVYRNGYKVLKICQHPILAISRHTHSALLNDWSLRNHFFVEFEVTLSRARGQ